MEIGCEGCPCVVYWLASCIDYCGAACRHFGDAEVSYARVGGCP